MRTSMTRSWLRNLTARYRRSIVVALALGFVAAAFSALLMFAAGYLICDTATIGTSLFSIMIPVACVQLFGVGRPLARYLERLVSHNWVLRITSDLDLALYRSFQKRADDPARSRSAGEYLGLLSDDIAHLQNLYLRVAFPSAIALLLYAGTCVVFGAFSIRFALVMLLALAIEVVVLPLFAFLATRSSASSFKELKSNERMKLSDDIQGALDWALSGRCEEAKQAHVESLEHTRQIDARRRFVLRLIELSQVLTLGLVLCLVLSWASYSFGNTELNPNWIAAFSLGFFPLIESFSLLPAAAASSSDHADAIARLDDHLEWSATETNDGRCENAGGFGLALSEVSYRYPLWESDSLKSVSLTIPAGQKVAVLGKSGAGKSTFAEIIRGRLVPCSGNVSLMADDQITPLSSGHVGFISQNEHIFNRSVRDNLNIGNPGASDDELWEVLDKVGLHSAVSSYPNGLDTVLGETGVGLSGGQAHRLALARVLVAQYPIVVIDEPFAALDPRTEEEILDTLLDVFADRTLLVITHHLARVERFDRVVFFTQGEIDLDDTPANLMENNARFQRLVALDRGSDCLLDLA